MILSLAHKEDIESIASLHAHAITTGFLRQLGHSFLCYLYRIMIESDDTFIIVARENNQVIGFVSGSSNLKKFYTFFLRKSVFQLFPYMLHALLNGAILLKCIETLKYIVRKKKSVQLPLAELLTIAIKERYQGRGVAQELLKNFITEMSKRNIKKFKVVVGDNLLHAIHFYEKMGFTFNSTLFIHKKIKSRIYTYVIQ